MQRPSEAVKKRPAWPEQWCRRWGRHGRPWSLRQLTFVLAILLSFVASSCGKKAASGSPIPPAVVVGLPDPGLRPAGPVSVPQTQAELPPPQPVPEGAAPPLRGPLPEQPKTPMGPPAPTGETAVAAQDPTPTPSEPVVAAPEPATQVPALRQVLTRAERQEYNQVIDSRIAETRQSLALLRGRPLTVDQKAQYKRIHVFLRQADEARAQNPALASNLAERARLLAEDLARNFR